jgi:uncharacterized protein YecT (DUF1311 family)
MNNSSWLILTGFVLACSSDLMSQTPDRVDMENIRNQPYMKYARQVRCDSTEGTTAEERICANLELQRQDSLLQTELGAILKRLKEAGDTEAERKLMAAQDLWERYRFSHCASLGEGQSAYSMILFMRCAAEVTAGRRKDLKHYDVP